MTVLALVALLVVVALLAYAAARAGRADREGDRKRLEAMDERRAAANLTPERRLEVSPQERPPAP